VLKVVKIDWPLATPEFDCAYRIGIVLRTSTGLSFKMPITVPSREHIMLDTPLRLSVAAALAFPDGSMTASGLRREGARGRLVIERIAGKDYTTVANIKRMRELCRVEARVPGCGSGLLAGKADGSLQMLSGSSSMATGMSPRDALRTKLAKRSNG
jgi:hypothetical protein